MTTATRSAPATEKQVAFANSLIDEVEALTDDVDVDGLRDMIADADKRTASMTIDHLIGTRDQLRREAREANRPADVPEGIHFTAGTVFKVQRSQHGRQYAKRLDTAGGSFEYVGQSPLRNLSDSTLMTLEDAQEFGQLYGICARCGALLTDEDSIDRGVGPVCAKRF